MIKKFIKRLLGYKKVSDERMAAYIASCEKTTADSMCVIGESMKSITERVEKL